ncbi:MAG: helix-turn-helix domain-containing protein [Solirubrobacteraceae bacterium]
MSNRLRELLEEVERLPALHDERMAIVRGALAGSPPPDYPLDGPHLAVVADDSDAEAVVACIGAPVLSARDPGGRCLAWLAAEAAELNLAGPAGVAGPRYGPEGFRLAHRHAELAHHISRARRGERLHVRDATIEAMVLGDADATGALARDELRGLGSGNPRARVLRQTVETWLERGGLNDAAAALGVTPRTVSYRLRRAEELLGGPIAARRAELEVALRLHGLFDAGAPPAP